MTGARDIGREISAIIDELVIAAVAFHVGKPRTGRQKLRLADALLAATMRDEPCATAPASNK